MPRRLATILTVLVLAGCAQAPVPADRFYRLVPGPTVRPVAAPLPGNLIVERFQADGLAGERALVYARADAPHELFQYRYRLWADPPTRMLQEITAGALRGAGVAEMVATPESRARADWTLSAKIKRLEQLVGAGSRVAMTVEFTVSRSADGALLLARDYAVEAPAADESVSGAVGALSGALEEILTRLIGDLTALAR